MRATAAGETEAFDLLVARHEAALYRFASRVCGDVSEAEDALQDGLVQAWRAAAAYRGEGAVLAWLYRVVLHACHHRQRRRLGEPRRFQSLTAVATVATPTATPERLAEQRELGAALDAALAELDEDARALLVLRDVEQLSGDEVAAILDLSLAAMKSRLHRARLELKARVEARLGKDAKVLP